MNSCLCAKCSGLITTRRNILTIFTQWIQVPLCGAKRHSPSSGARVLCMRKHIKCAISLLLATSASLLVASLLLIVVPLLLLLLFLLLVAMHLLLSILRRPTPGHLSEPGSVDGGGLLDDLPIHCESGGVGVRKFGHSSFLGVHLLGGVFNGFQVQPPY